MPADARGSSRRGKPPEIASVTAAPGAPGAQTPGLRARIIEGTDAGRWVPLRPGAPPVLVGRRRALELPLEDPFAAEEHLALQCCPDGIGVRALDATRPVFVGAVRVMEAVVPPGTRIRLGASMLALETPRVDGDVRALLRAEGLALQSPAMREVAEKVLQLAPHTNTVLIEGETGTGKEVVARAIHRLGLRCNGPFVVVDCGALPGNLLESELFGHERGSFTGAERRHAGAFERAHGGTLFLDEIGELPLSQQPALLGVLQRRRFRRVGGGREIEVDVRVIAATYRDLERQAEIGSFRLDLYYRLASGRILIPPLRDRLEDLPVLVAHLSEELTGSPGGVALGAQELATLQAHRFPGNVRELRVLIERLHTMGRLDLGPARRPTVEPPPPSPTFDPGRARDPRSYRPGDAASPSIPPPPPLPDPGALPVPRYREARATALQDFERSYLGHLLEASRGNASEAARLAKMDRPFLLKLLRRHGLR